jgi:DNA-binding SARP family transcriptional activator/TolB-like protein
MSIHLATLGQLKVLKDGQEIALPVQRRVRAALLVYLGIERDVSREKVASVFWPDSDEDKARHALSQALYQLRQIIGEDWLIVTGDRIRVSNVAQIDARVFEEAVLAKEYDVALNLYGGSFLSGVDNLPANSNFQNWADTKRAYLDRLHRQVRRELITKQVGAVDYATAVATAREWVRLSPAEDEAHHKLIELLAQSGQVTEAVRHYESYERQLAKEDLRPLDETVALVGSLRREDLATKGRIASIQRRETDDKSVSGPERLNTALRRRELFTANRAAILSLIAVLTITGAMLGRARWKARFDALDENRVLILPFRTIAPDSSVTALAEGMVDLLATKLAEGGIATAVDPAEAISAFRAHQRGSPPSDRSLSRELGRKFGARQVITGSLVVTLDQLTLNASLTDAGSGSARTASVHGPVTDVLSLVDALAKRLLGAVGEERDDRLESLTTTSFPALQAYLRGLRAWRSAGAPASAEHFREALQHDSTFALAALRLAVLNDEGEPFGRTTTREYLRTAFTHRHRLSKRDQLWLASLAGSHYPRWPWLGEQIRATRQALDKMQGSTELSEQLGYLLFVAGAFVDQPKSLEAAQHALMRAFETDSLLTEPRLYLFHIAALRDDTVMLRDLADVWFRRHGDHALTPYVRWLLAVFENDTRALDSIRVALPSADRTALYAIFDGAETQGRRIEDAELSMRIMRDTRPLGWGIFERDRALNAGRYREVIQGWKDAAKRNNVSEAAFLVHRFYFAMYAGVDSAGVGALLPEFAEPWEADVVPVDGTRGYYLEMRCSLEEWRLFNNDRSRSQETIDLLRRTPLLPAETATAEARLTICPLLLEAMMNVMPDKRSTALERLDSISRAGFEADISHLMGLNLVISRLWEKQGDKARALAAVRRRWRFQTVYLSTYLREEGRLAALQGDLPGAIRAYRHFLALRNDPDPHLREERNHIQREVERLEKAHAQMMR